MQVFHKNSGIKCSFKKWGMPIYGYKAEAIIYKHFPLTDPTRLSSDFQGSWFYYYISVKQEVKQVFSNNYPTDKFSVLYVIDFVIVFSFFKQYKPLMVSFSPCSLRVIGGFLKRENKGQKRQEQGKCPLNGSSSGGDTCSMMNSFVFS